MRKLFYVFLFIVALAATGAFGQAKSITEADKIGISGG